MFQKLHHHGFSDMFSQIIALPNGYRSIVHFFVLLGAIGTSLHPSEVCTLAIQCNSAISNSHTSSPDLWTHSAAESHGMLLLDLHPAKSNPCNTLLCAVGCTQSRGQQIGAWIFHKKGGASRYDLLLSPTLFREAQRAI